MSEELFAWIESEISGDYHLVGIRVNSHNFPAVSTIRNTIKGMGPHITKLNSDSKLKLIRFVAQEILEER